MPIVPVNHLEGHIYSVFLERDGPLGIARVLQDSIERAPEGTAPIYVTVEHPDTDVILATGGSAMVRAAYSKGKPAYGVGSGNVPVYVDRSADLAKAAADIVYGVSFDWGTLCSTERSVVADYPIRDRLKAALQAEGAFFLDEAQKEKLRRVVWKDRGLNPDQVGQSPQRIAAMAGFSVPETTRALVAEVQEVGKAEPLSMETLSPILSFYTADGWEAGCARCIEILEFGGIGHTLALHAGSERVIEQFALKKPSMRIVVNTVAALGSADQPEGIAEEELPRRVVEIVYADVDPVLWGAAELSVRAQLDHLRSHP